MQPQNIFHTLRVTTKNSIDAFKIYFNPGYILKRIIKIAFNTVTCKYSVEA